MFSSCREKRVSVTKLVSGRMPNPSDPSEVLASFNLESDEGLHLGSVIRVPLYARSQAKAFNQAIGVPPAPTGPDVALRIVGFEVAEYEFPAGTSPSYDVYATPAFARSVLPKTAAGYLDLVRLRGGAAAFPRFDSEVLARHLPGVEGVESEDAYAASVVAAIHPQAIGWWIIAALAGAVGIAVLGQALFRQSLVESEEYSTLIAVGVNRRTLVVLGLARNLLIALAGSLGADALAIVLSPLAPLGEARTAESSSGITADPLVLPIGALAIVVIVLVLGIWPALHSSRPAKGRGSSGNPTVETRDLPHLARSATERRDRRASRPRTQE